MYLYEPIEAGKLDGQMRALSQALGKPLYEDERIAVFPTR